jgi:hypothetical protein
MFGLRWWEIVLGLVLAAPWLAIILGIHYNRVSLGLGWACMLSWQVFFLSGIVILVELGWLPE